MITLRAVFWANIEKVVLRLRGVWAVVAVRAGFDADTVEVGVEAVGLACEPGCNFDAVRRFGKFFERASVDFARADSVA